MGRFKPSLLRYHDLKNIHAAFEQLEKCHKLEEVLSKKIMEKENVEAKVTLVFT